MMDNYNGLHDFYFVFFLVTKTRGQASPRNVYIYIQRNIFRMRKGELTEGGVPYMITTIYKFLWNQKIYVFKNEER